MTAKKQTAAKQKAVEIVDEVFQDMKVKFGDNEITKIFAKRCAIINISHQIEISDWYERRYKTNTVNDYLREVRSEIEKL